MRKSFFILLLPLVFSCKIGVKFEVSNESNTTIDSFFVSNGYDDIRIGILNPGEVKSEFLKFTRNTPDKDGSYNIECYSKEFYRKENFGYYSNGIPSNSSFKIEIENGTIIIKEFFHSNY